MSQASKYRRRLARDRELRIEAASLGVRPKELTIARSIAAALNTDVQTVIDHNDRLDAFALAAAQQYRTQ